MQGQGILILAIAFGVALWAVYKLGRKAAQLDAIRTQMHQQEKEQKYVQEIKERVSSLTGNDVRRRLHESSSYKR